MKIIIFKCLFIFTSLLLSSVSSPIELQSSGFTANLIYRDSINPNSSSSSAHQWDLMINKALQRSKRRADHLSNTSASSSSSSSSGNIISSSDLQVSSDGDFLMKISLGTPPVEINGIADTSSALTWTQCTPCDVCFPQNLPLFDPKKSDTYKTVRGNSRQCKTLGGVRSINRDNTCWYSADYPDKSYSKGVLSFDVLKLRPNIESVFVFGCGHENVGKFPKETTGVIGLGYGPGSFVNQMNKLVDGRFAYCLASHSYTTPKVSTMFFGDKAMVPSGAGTVSTGLQIFKNSYAIKLKSVSVGKKKLISTSTRFSNASSESKLWFFSSERMVIDSGSMLSYLPKKFYNPLEAALKKAIKSQLVGPRNRLLRLCYKANGGKMSDVPLVKLQFAGAKVELGPENTFLRVSEDVSCLGFVPHEGVAVLGNLAQRNFMVSYHLKKKTVSFKPMDCSRMG